MADGSSSRRDRPVAAMTARRPVVVRPTPDTTHPGDAPAIVEPGPGPIDPSVVVDRLAPGHAGVPRVEVIVDGWRFVLEVEDAEQAELRSRAERDRAAIAGSGAPVEIRAIIPGRVVAVRVSPDDVVEAGQPLLVVEAMKMQNELRAPRAGTVRQVVASVGSTIEVGELLVVLG
jgi:biotin carboxyl carrier protein